MNKVDIDHNFESKQAGLKKREKPIQHVFDKLVPRYDLISDAMSIGYKSLNAI